MRALVTALVVVALVVPLLRADDPEPPGEGLEALQGTWQVTSIKGDRMVEEDVTKIKLTLAKDKLIVKGIGKDPRESKIKLDLKKKPKQIDITYDGRTTLGIYKIEKGVLYLTTSEGISKTRPKSFT